MTDVLKKLGQSSPAATTLTDVYTAAYPSVVSSVVICNTNASAVTIRFSHAVAAAADAIAQYLYYDLTVDANDTFIATVGLTLAATDVLRCYASTTNVAFNVYGTEVTP